MPVASKFKTSSKIVVDDSLLRKAARIGGFTAADRALKETAQDILENLKGAGPNAAPLRTGRLRAGYFMRRAGVLSVWITNRVPYAGYVEFGTSRRAPRPHFRPAMIWGQQRLAERLNDILVAEFAAL